MLQHHVILNSSRWFWKWVPHTRDSNQHIHNRTLTNWAFKLQAHHFLHHQKTKNPPHMSINDHYFPSVPISKSSKRKANPQRVADTALCHSLILRVYFAQGFWSTQNNSYNWAFHRLSPPVCTSSENQNPPPMSINDQYPQCPNLQVSKKDDNKGLYNMLQNLHLLQHHVNF